MAFWSPQGTLWHPYFRMPYITMFPLYLWTSLACGVSDSIQYVGFPHICMCEIWLFSFANLFHVYLIIRPASKTWGQGKVCSSPTNPGKECCRPTCHLAASQPHAAPVPGHATYWLWGWKTQLFCCPHIGTRGRSPAAGPWSALLTVFWLVHHCEMSEHAHLYHLPSFCCLQWIEQEYDPSPPWDMRNCRSCVVGSTSAAS